MRARHEAEVIKIELQLEEAIMLEQIFQNMRCRNPEVSRKMSQMYFDLRTENRESRNYNGFIQPGGAFLFAGQWCLTGPMAIEELNPEEAIEEDAEAGEEPA